MSPSQKASRRARERLARVRAEERRKQRRNKRIMVSGAVVVTVAVVAGGGYAILRRDSGDDAQVRAVQGVRSFSGLGRNHVPGPVNYPQSPPVGGDHNQVWQNCGIYDKPVQKENAVHSLEHGAVWITYRPGLAADQVGRLRTLARGKPFVLLGPYDKLPSAVVASAWGKQLAVTDAGDARLSRFVRDFAQSPKAPEPGAPCSNGTGRPST